jgi:RNA polymerase sigma-70 factor (ECF subfamily)
MSIKQQNGNLDADRFADLHCQYGSRLLSRVTGMVRDRTAAEDITATAFATAFEKRQDFRGDASAYTWLYRIAMNEVHGSRRGYRPISLESLTGVPEALTECDRTAEVMERFDCRARLRRALRKLPAVYRQVLLDHFVQEYSVTRIARRERIPLGTVLSRLFTAKRLLRAAWEA